MKQSSHIIREETGVALTQVGSIVVMQATGDPNRVIGHLTQNFGGIRHDERQDLIRLQEVYRIQMGMRMNQMMSQRKMATSGQGHTDENHPRMSTLYVQRVNTGNIVMKNVFLINHLDDICRS